MIRFANEVEKALRENRILKPKRPQWELFRSASIVEVLHKAREMGWGENKVQVKLEPVGEDRVEYYIEPFEEHCSCPSLLKYDDYFLRPDADEDEG